MGITKILNANHVILDVEAAGEAEVVEEPTDILQKGGAISCRETFIQNIQQHELESSTGFENHIAIPRGKSSAVVSTTLAVGRTCQKVLWETLDGGNVQCIVLFAVHLEDQNTTHIRLSSQVAGVLANDDTIEQLLVESSPQKITEFFNQYAESNVC